MLALPFALALHALTELPAATERDQTLDEHATRNLRSLYPHLVPYQDQVAEALRFCFCCLQTALLALFADYLHALLCALEDGDLLVKVIEEGVQLLEVDAAISRVLLSARFAV